GPLRLPGTGTGRGDPPTPATVGGGVLARAVVRRRPRPGPGRAPVFPTVPGGRSGAAPRADRRVHSYTGDGSAQLCGPGTAAGGSDRAGDRARSLGLRRQAPAVRRTGHLHTGRRRGGAALPLSRVVGGLAGRVRLPRARAGSAGGTGGGDQSVEGDRQPALPADVGGGGGRRADGG